MDIILIMLIGAIIGKKFFPSRLKKINEHLQMICVISLIFLMGVSLGQTEGFLNEIYEIGFVSVIFSIVPMIFSLLLVYFLSKTLMKDKESK